MVIGVLFAVSVMVGSVLAQWAPVAVIGMFLMGSVPLSSQHEKFSGSGPHDLSSARVDWFTYHGLDESVGVCALFTLGSAIARLGALCFPEYN